MPNLYRRRITIFNGALPVGGTGIDSQPIPAGWVQSGTLIIKQTQGVDLAAFLQWALLVSADDDNVLTPVQLYGQQTIVTAVAAIPPNASEGISTLYFTSLPPSSVLASYPLTGLNDIRRFKIRFRDGSSSVTPVSITAVLALQYGAF